MGRSQLLLCASTSGWQQPGLNWDFVSPEVFSWHLHERSLLPIIAPSSVLAIFLTINRTIHAFDHPPLTHDSDLQSSSNGETLIWNICSVSAKGAAKWRLANLLGIHFERLVSSRGTNQHTLSTLLQWPFMLLSNRWIYLAYTDLLVGLEVASKTPTPLKFSIYCTSPKTNKKSECFFKALTCTPTSTVTISLKWPWHRNSTYCRLWTGAE